MAGPGYEFQTQRKYILPMFARYLRKQQEIRSESDHREINTRSRSAGRAGERKFALTAQSQGSLHRQLVAEISMHSTMDGTTEM